MGRKTTAAGLLTTLGLSIGGAAYAALVRRHGRKQADSAPAYTARRNANPLETSGRTVTIRQPRAELYAFWRDFSNLVSVMENVEAIELLDAGKGRAKWIIKAPAGRTVEATTEIAEEKKDAFIAWRSVEASEIETEGRVTFEDAPGERGTRVTLVIGYKPPAGTVGKSVAKPEIQARHDLKRFKMLMEAGEIATSASRPEQKRAAQQEKST